MNQPKLSLTGTSVAKSYHFSAPSSSLGGWFIATINDKTGELAIQSDWGEWAHRWPLSGMAEGQSLTSFLAGMDHVGYVAGKLYSGRRDAEVFDAEKTVVALRERMLDKHHDPTWFWTRMTDEERELWDDLWDFVTEDPGSAEMFMERLPEDVFTMITDCPYEYFATVPSSAANVLRKVILPALFAALAAEKAVTKESFPCAT